MVADAIAERICANGSFTCQAHQGFGVQAEKRGAFFSVDIGLGLGSADAPVVSWASRGGA